MAVWKTADQEVAINRLKKGTPIVIEVFWIANGTSTGSIDQLHKMEQIWDKAMSNYESGNLDINADMGVQISSVVGFEK